LGLGRVFSLIGKYLTYLDKAWANVAAGSKIETELAVHRSSIGKYLINLDSV
jgi:hypothetical protein